MEALKKTYRALFRILETFAMVCMTVMVIIVFAQVAGRKLLGVGLSWGEEVSTLMMVWFSFVGIAIGVLEKLHMSIELFTMRLPANFNRLLDRINYTIIAAYGALMIYYGVIIIKVTINTTMPATRMPSAVLYIILPLAGLLVLINGLIVALSPKGDGGLGNRKGEINDA